MAKREYSAGVPVEVALNAAHTTRTTTSTQPTLVLDGELLRRILNQVGLVTPPHAAISIRIPGGGDWSNTNLEIDSEHPIRIVWTDVKDT